MSKKVVHISEKSKFSKQGKWCKPEQGVPGFCTHFPNADSSAFPLFDKGTRRPYRYETEMLNMHQQQ